MDYDDVEPEQSVLSYGEFVRRETLMAWVERKRAHELGNIPSEGRRTARGGGPDVEAARRL
jgi:hypothetical protein